ncbi:AraC family transcriptional regulator [Ancylomarina euxinus]|uniref:AraC family transcriptional regulator n=1 Tax=Ancylomarina euxinus TaxID=2283627 RepID=A0A425XWI9_9BACT|nr:AraC family transcriptional regulator [Ancylomarina euxinus]MCZ4696404.1 AraC family transcriptional regulator [Ancylomarina euxinus]RRG19017.1 AraC family transcriptional regulator [Ancylomarina euxinus]
MKTETINKLFEIHIEEMEVWTKRPYKNNFFEIVYIEKGTGSQCINQHEFEYIDGNIFFLPPLDCHSFKILSPSKFYFIRFTDHFFLQKNNLTDYNVWFDKIAYIIAKYNKVPGDIISSEHDRQFIINNIKSIYQEYLRADSYSDSIISGSIASILNILARSIENKYVGKANETDNRFGEILRYINTHLLDNENLRLSVLAENFGISKTYFSEYFKKQAGVSLVDYVLKSKLKIVETKVLHTDLSLKEIAWQLNFTDSSHLARTFKKTYGMTVKEFKSKGHTCG